MIHQTGTLAVDYANGSLFDPADLARRGVKLIMRYLPGGGSTWKHVTAAEIARIHAAGIGFLPHFEASATAAAGGRATGQTHGLAATLGAKRVGLPKEYPVTFAVDFQPAGHQYRDIAEYFRGVASTCEYPVGVYGSAAVVKMVMSSGLAVFAVQTVAWSGGVVAEAAAVLQHSRITAPKLVGLVGLDQCTVLAPTNSWGPTPPPPPPTPPPLPPVPNPLPDIEETVHPLLLLIVPVPGVSPGIVYAIHPGSRSWVPNSKALDAIRWRAAAAGKTIPEETSSDKDYVRSFPPLDTESRHALQAAGYPVDAWGAPA